MTIQTKKLYDFLELLKLTSSTDDPYTFFQFLQPIESELFEKSFNLIPKTQSSFYWDYPESNESFFGFEEIFTSNSEQELNLLNIISNRNEYGIERIPEILVSIKFPINENFLEWEDFKASNWFIPRLLCYHNNDSYYLGVFFTGSEINNIDTILKQAEDLLENLGAEELPEYTDSQFRMVNMPSPQEWHDMINSVLNKINSGKVNKVVLSRMVEYSVNRLPDFTRVISRLKREYPNSYIFIFKQKSSIFFGASPEKLLKINKNNIETEALAGTIKRGVTVQEDELLSKIFFDDKKELTEHQSVVKYIVNALSDFTTDISYDKSPQIKKLKYIQHLWTPIKAKLKPDYSILSIINRLHPTPAVCGEPKEAALEIIEELEVFDRGLFAGVIGWYNKNGYGEFAVTIRSGLIKENKLLLFAGCGIVEGSTPGQEYRETELKLKSILSLFENENTN
ncbi:MAG: isochorismate synthase [Melioribacteraceae bacterium]|nr:isochorismate synthase [Melioribacteraceae bacterium]